MKDPRDPSLERVECTRQNVDGAALPPVALTKQPGCDSQGDGPPSVSVTESAVHGVTKPVQLDAPAASHEHRRCASHADSVVSEVHVVIVPLQVDVVHSQPSSSSQTASVGWALHGVMVPVHVPVLHSQSPSEASHSPSVVAVEQDGTPVHVSVFVSQVQPAPVQTVSP
jgi:hypothetical protein